MVLARIGIKGEVRYVPIGRAHRNRLSRLLLELLGALPLCAFEDLSRLSGVPAAAIREINADFARYLAPVRGRKGVMPVDLLLQVQATKDQLEISGFNSLAKRTTHLIDPARRTIPDRRALAALLRLLWKREPSRRELNSAAARLSQLRIENMLRAGDSGDGRKSPRKGFGGPVPTLARLDG